jgi:hypothetical protein
MQWIGSLYAPDVTSAGLRDIALNQLHRLVLPPNGFTVQTLLIAAIAVHCEDDMVLSRALLDEAILLALEIRMNYRAFANMEGDPVLREPWRRTYWDLYDIDCMFVATRRGPSFL